jgi:ATP-dependent Zn protease
VLTEKRDKLETVTQRLLEIEVMEGEELRQLLTVTPAPSPDDISLPATD